MNFHESNLYDKFFEQFCEITLFKEVVMMWVIKLAIIIIFIWCSPLSVNAAAGYIISSGRIQHRVYEDGKEYNELYFEVKDDLE